MRLKLYRAADVAAAMRSVRAELGSEALILSTRRVAGGVELTAALEPEENPPADFPDPETDRHPASLGSAIAGADTAQAAGRLAALRRHGVPAALHRALATGPLDAAIAAALRFAPLPLKEGTAPLLFAGPHGAGKTLTVARLATRLVLGGVRPLVITADGQRAGAAEQLAAYTRLLGLTLVVASHPATLGRALERREPDVPALIDAPGADPIDPAQRDELAMLAGTARARVVAVLPAGLDAAETADIAAALVEAGAKSLVATRLDVTRRVGGVLAAIAAGLAGAEAGVGPGAADGLAPLTPALLAARLNQTPSGTIRP